MTKRNRHTDHTGLSLLVSLSQQICHFLLTSLFSVVFVHALIHTPENLVQLPKKLYWWSIWFCMHTAASCYRRTQSLLGLPLTLTLTLTLHKHSQIASRVVVCVLLRYNNPLTMTLFRSQTQSLPRTPQGLTAIM